MTVALLIAALILVVAAMFFEEASVWYGGNAIAMLDDDEEAERGKEFARFAEEARLLSQFSVGLGFAGFGVAASKSLGIAWPVGVGVIVSALIAAALLPAHWRSPWSLPGRALFQPVRWLGVILAAPLNQVRRLAGWEPGASLEAGWDRERRWLRGRPREDEAEEALATLQDFGESMVDEVMVPRSEIVGLPVGTTVAAALQRLREEGYTRYPVYRESMDNVVGVLHGFDLIEAPHDTLIDTLARPPLFTNETKPVGQLLREMQLSYNQMAVVADEFGGTAGMVTVEDLLEELVGEIRDETDIEEEMLRRIEPGLYWVDGSMRVDELNEMLELNLPEGEYDTVAGMVVDRLERIPRPGEKVREGGLQFEIVAAEPNRVNALRMTVEDERERNSR